MSWNTTTLSTTNSIAMHQYNINTYVTSPQTWDYKITLAKSKLQNDIYSRLSHTLTSLDDVSNLTTLTMASDYLSLAMIYTDLASQGLNEVFQNKKQWYWRQYAYELEASVPRLSYAGISMSVVGSFIL